MLYVLFSGWLFWLIIKFLRFIHTYIWVLSPFITYQYFIKWIQHNCLSVHPQMDIVVFFFQFAAITNKNAMNIMYKCFSGYMLPFLVGKYPEAALLGDMINSCLSCMSILNKHNTTLYLLLQLYLKPEIQVVRAFQCLFPFKIVSDIGPLNFHIHFRNALLISTKSCEFIKSPLYHVFLYRPRFC